MSEPNQKAVEDRVRAMLGFTGLKLIVLAQALAVAVAGLWAGAIGALSIASLFLAFDGLYLITAANWRKSK